MSHKEMEAYFRLLLMAEYNCHPTFGRKHLFTHSLSIRCRWRRIVVARKLVSLGSGISELATAHTLPRGKNWPGVVHLVAKNGYTLASKENPTPIIVF